MDIKLLMDLAAALLNAMERRYGPEGTAMMLEQWATVVRTGLGRRAALAGSIPPPV